MMVVVRGKRNTPKQLTRRAKVLDFDHYWRNEKSKLANLYDNSRIDNVYHTVLTNVPVNGALLIGANTCVRVSRTQVVMVNRGTMTPIIILCDINRLHTDLCVIIDHDLAKEAIRDLDKYITTVESEAADLTAKQLKSQDYNTSVVALRSISKGAYKSGDAVTHAMAMTILALIQQNPGAIDSSVAALIGFVIRANENKRNTDYSDSTNAVLLLDELNVDQRNRDNFEAAWLSNLFSQLIAEEKLYATHEGYASLRDMVSGKIAEMYNHGSNGTPEFPADNTSKD
jgi:hypothetical protein